MVVATGRFNAPHVPDIPGLQAWADQFPDRVIHSRQYRRPQPYTNQTVLIVGGSVSGVQDYEIQCQIWIPFLGQCYTDGY